MNIKWFQILIFIFSIQAFAQAPAPTPSETPPPANISSSDFAVNNEPEASEKPNGRRIRRQLNLIFGVEHDEEFLIPLRPITLKGAGVTENFEINRIGKTDFFRILPKKVSNGIATINDKKTGQILVELRYDIRDGVIEKQMREIQALLGDIEGVEYKIVNGQILLDGYVLLSRDLIRIANVIKQFPGVKSIATLSPIARKKIAEYIARDVNNPEVSITAVGDYIKLEGVVNSKEEHNRIKTIVGLYMPDLVTDVAPDTLDGVKITGRKSGGDIDKYIIDLITEKKDEEKTEPPPKMIQVVVHFVQFIESYGKSFLFRFAPSFAAGTTSAGSVNDTFNLISRLAPKLQWAKQHGYARVLDTASILTQDKKQGQYINTIEILSKVAAPSAGTGTPSTANNNIRANVIVELTPTIKSERSGLIELQNIHVKVDDNDSQKITSNEVRTTLSVRDRQSAAFAGIIKKKSANEYGGDPGVDEAIVSFQSRKKYDKSSSNFVVFVTPIIKSSASAGVDQVKKKFRLRE